MLANGKAIKSWRRHRKIDNLRRLEENDTVEINYCNIKMPKADFSPRNDSDVIPEKIVEDEATEFKQRQRRRSSVSLTIINNIRRGSNISVESCTCTTSMYLIGFFIFTLDVHRCVFTD